MGVRIKCCVVQTPYQLVAVMHQFLVCLLLIYLKKEECHLAEVGVIFFGKKSRSTECNCFPCFYKFNLKSLHLAFEGFGKHLAATFAHVFSKWQRNSCGSPSLRHWSQCYQRFDQELVVECEKSLVLVPKIIFFYLLIKGAGMLFRIVTANLNPWVLGFLLYIVLQLVMCLYKRNIQ